MQSKTRHLEETQEALFSVLLAASEYRGNLVGKLGSRRVTCNANWGAVRVEILLARGSPAHLSSARAIPCHRLPPGSLPAVTAKNIHCATR